MRYLILLAILFNGLASCTPEETVMTEEPEISHPLLDKYTPFRLTADLTGLSENQREMVKLLIEAAHEIDAIYWQQTYGDREALFAGITNPALRRFAEINQGPWDRLDENEPFIPGIGPKPLGANFYPADMTEEEFEAVDDESLKNLYTMVRRDAAGNLQATPYHEYFMEETEKAAMLLEKAADLAESFGFKNYLELRAEALRTDDYFESDMAWMGMKDNTIDIVIGPIETYEDQLFGYKASHETFVLLKDLAWSDRLARYAGLLPMLQRGLPVPDQYKTETPGTDSDLGAYDVLFVSGDANAGSKTIAINLPNDERVQLEKGTRRLQLKNPMRAKFEKILEPIADLIIAEDQRKHVTFDAFFGNTMFHEVAHGLGIKNTISGNGTVRQALRNHASAIEEGKADILGLHMVSELIDQGEWDADLMDHNTTFLASIFRSIRFGGSSAHGRANLIRFNFFNEMGAFAKDATTGRYRVDPVQMADAVRALSERILTLQGDGDYEAVEAFVSRYGEMSPGLQADLNRISDAGIPVDIVYEQGLDVLEL